MAERSIILLSGGDFGVPLSDERESLTVALGELDHGFLALANGEDVAKTGSEHLALGVLDVDDLVATGVVLNVHERTDTTDIVTANDEHH